MIVDRLPADRAESTLATRAASLGHGGGLFSLKYLNWSLRQSINLITLKNAISRKREKTPRVSFVMYIPNISFTH